VGRVRIVSVVGVGVADDVDQRPKVLNGAVVGCACGACDAFRICGARDSPRRVCGAAVLSLSTIALLERAEPRKNVTTLLRDVATHLLDAAREGEKRVECFDVVVVRTILLLVLLAVGCCVARHLVHATLRTPHCG